MKRLAVTPNDWDPNSVQGYGMEEIGINLDKGTTGRGGLTTISVGTPTVNISCGVQRAAVIAAGMDVASVGGFVGIKYNEAA